MGKSVTKHRNWERILTFLLALTMLAAYLPAGVARAADEAADSNVHVLDAAQDLTAFAAGEKAAGDTTEVGGYFSILWSEKSKVDSSSKTWDDDYSSGQRINFGGKATTESNSVMFKTTGPATVKIWWVAGGTDREMAILDSGGNVAAQTTGGAYETNSPYLSTLELTAAGTYFLGGLSANNYIFKVEVAETVGEKAPRADWSKAAAPEITAVAYDAKNPGSVVVTVSGVVGYDAADQITVIMRDEDGWELKRLSSLAEKSEHQLTFAPSETGTYKFEVIATREDETEVHKGAAAKSFSFTYPLGVPIMKYAVNDGKGGLTVEWNFVKEATGYIVTAGSKTVTTTGLNSTKATVAGLQVGSKVEVTVAAVRGAETGAACDPFEVTISDKAETAWVFATFGQSTSTKNNGYEELENGDVHVWSINGSGKVQPSAQDGLAFYYTAIDPLTTNFKLTATAHVNSWTYSNGQDGFGLIVMDKVGVHGDTSPVWSNSFMAGVTGFSSDYNGQRVQMRLGVGSLERSGVTEDVTTATAPATYKGTWRTLDITGFSSDIRNLVGNCTNASAVPGETLPLTDFTLTIEKDDKGYHISYLDHNGVLRTNDYLDPGALNYVDPYVYVGMFAARNADITFTGIELTTSPASGASSTPGTGGTGDVTAAPSYDFRNPTVSNREKFDLDLRVNVDGKAVVTDANGIELYKGAVKAGERNLVTVTLAKGANAFTAVVTPDKDALTADGVKLTSYEPVTITKDVTYTVDERTVIYVAPNGKTDAAGTRANPTTLAEAVKCPAPGAVIIMLEGTYNLTGGITIQRGINGTADQPITLMADPNAAARPVINWGRQGSGLTLSADYWHLYGFDTAYANGKGIHIGGNCNTIERVNAHHNMQSGVSISRTWSSDAFIDWPSNNLILNCSAWLNADSGYEDADGFEAKLTNGDGNVFDGCIAAYNADDGWDLFARGTANGSVTIRNSIAFKNGYDIVDGKEVNAGNGNGFKLGGNSYPVNHVIENSIAFANKHNGFTCNSNPNLTVRNCTGFDNAAGNLALYTSGADSAYVVEGFISFMGDSTDSIDPKGTQNRADYLKSTNYFTGHTSGEKVAADWFVNLDTATAITSGVSRNKDGSINMNGFLALTNKAPKDAGARLENAEQSKAPALPEIPDEPGWTNPFTDVSESDWFYGDVSYVEQNGLMGSVGNGKFNPGDTTTRGMLMTILARLDGVDTSGSNPWYQTGMEWAMRTKVSDGTNPEGPINREQFATMLWRYAGEPEVTGSLSSYPDASNVNSWASTAMVWAVQNGIIKGIDGKLNPQGPATRSQAAAMLTRFCQNIVK